MAEQSDSMPAHDYSAGAASTPKIKQRSGGKHGMENESEAGDRNHKQQRRGDHHGFEHKGDRKNKSKNMGRVDYFRSNPDKRQKVVDSRDKSQHSSTDKAAPIYATKFSANEITGEDRRPKRKVAVMLGYSGTGYKGMQIMPNQRTIEGDLFQAFVKAGAISKANADDPKKSQLVRCARTDKGVHAAGNVISLKLIVEDADIVAKINSHLPDQIRVWGYERTTGSFSSYAQCDSRWYEYLIPTYCFLPPHPSTWLAKELKTIAEEDGLLDVYNERQREVLDFWDNVEATEIKPLLESFEPEIRTLVQNAIYNVSSISSELLEEGDDEAAVDEETQDAPTKAITSSAAADIGQENNADVEHNNEAEQSLAVLENSGSENGTLTPEMREQLDAAIKLIKAAYLKAKDAYRIQPERIARVKNVLQKYEGTRNFHNFTIKKNPRDSSAQRFIRSFHVNGDPVLINGTQWLSLKVHGQSFMMHQIRKMVAMAALIVRSGCDPERLTQALSQDVYNIPKAPGLGLLLERPVFESYNQRADTFQRNPLSFDKYEKEMVEFKQREIYDKIFQEEAANHVFHVFFAQLENFREPHFLFLSTRGVAASKGSRKVSNHQEPTRMQKRQHRRLQQQSENVPRLALTAGEGAAEASADQSASLVQETRDSQETQEGEPGQAEPNHHLQPHKS